MTRNMTRCRGSGGHCYPLIGFKLIISFSKPIAAQARQSRLHAASAGLTGDQFAFSSKLMFASDVAPIQLTGLVYVKYRYRSMR